MDAEGEVHNEIEFIGVEESISVIETVNRINAAASAWKNAEVQRTIDGMQAIEDMRREEAVKKAIKGEWAKAYADIACVVDEERTKAINAERERCAKIAYSFQGGPWHKYAADIAAAIRSTPGQEPK